MGTYNFQVARAAEAIGRRPPFHRSGWIDDDPLFRQTARLPRFRGGAHQDRATFGPAVFLKSVSAYQTIAEAFRSQRLGWMQTLMSRFTNLSGNGPSRSHRTSTINTVQALFSVLNIRAFLQIFHRFAPSRNAMKSVPEHTSRWCNPITILALLLRKEKSKNEQVESIGIQAEDVSTRQTWGSATSFPVETADTPQPGGSVASCLGQQAVSPTLAVPNPRAEDTRGKSTSTAISNTVKFSVCRRSFCLKSCAPSLRTTCTCYARCLSPFGASIEARYSQHFTVGMKESGV